MKKKQTLPLAMIIMAFVILLVGDLLLWFFLDYSRVSPPRLPADTHHKVDAIAVLAGGSERLQPGRQPQLINIFHGSKEIVSGKTTVFLPGHPEDPG